ncbi:unnamed protein product [Closterium sp. NIES-65]|nr:unnamed protein product [Closterium sp. NIES-65]
MGPGAAVEGLRDDEEVTERGEMPRTEMRVVVRTVYHGSHNHPPPPPDASTTRLLCYSSPCPAAAACASATTLAPVAPSPAAACAFAPTCAIAAATSCAPAPTALPHPVSFTPPLSHSSPASSTPATSPRALATSCAPLTTCAPVTTWAPASLSHPFIANTSLDATACIPAAAAALPSSTTPFPPAMSHPERVAHPVVSEATVLFTGPSIEGVPSSAAHTQPFNAPVLPPDNFSQPCQPSSSTDDSGIENGVVGIQGSDGPEGVFGPAATQNRSSDADHGVLDCSQQMLYGCGCAVVFLMSQVWVSVCCGVSHEPGLGVGVLQLLQGRHPLRTHGLDMA